MQSEDSGLSRKPSGPSGGCYVASPNLTVAETKRLERIGKAVDEVLDKVA